jgi:hypothetical protein
MGASRARPQSGLVKSFTLQPHRFAHALATRRQAGSFPLQDSLLCAKTLPFDDATRHHGWGLLPRISMVSDRFFIAKLLFAHVARHDLGKRHLIGNIWVVRRMARLPLPRDRMAEVLNLTFGARPDARNVDFNGGHSCYNEAMDELTPAGRQYFAKLRKAERSGKTLAMLRALQSTMGGAKSIHVIQNHDNLSRMIEVEHESGKKSLIVGPMQRDPRDRREA